MKFDDWKEKVTDKNKALTDLMVVEEEYQAEINKIFTNILGAAPDDIDFKGAWIEVDYNTKSTVKHIRVTPKRRRMLEEAFGENAMIIFDIENGIFTFEVRIAATMEGEL